MQDRTDLPPLLGKQVLPQVPPWLVVAWEHLAGIPLERWVLLATLIYTLLQILIALSKLRRRPALVVEEEAVDG